MKIQPIVHKTLAEAVAGKLTASLLDGSLQPGAQLPPERELITRFGISRTTLREALKAMEENGLVESRKNVGWFALQVDESNMTQAREMAGPARQEERLARNEPPTGPIRLPIASEKPIHIPNLQKDRFESGGVDRRQRSASRLVLRNIFASAKPLSAAGCLWPHRRVPCACKSSSHECGRT